ncbi:SOSS complex subunit B family protein [Nanoarchaeota archaeon]
MQINELKPKQGKIELTAKVSDKGEVREFNKFGKEGKVCNATIKDETGEIALTLWNDQVDQINIGDKVKITNGYVNEWQGEMQLTSGKFGELEVVEKGEASSETAPAETSESTEEPKQDAPEEEVVE